MKTTLELKGDRALVITRTFGAKPQKVFDAWTKAEQVAKWWAPVSRGVTMVSCEADVRVGGKYRYVLDVRGAQQIAFSGEYREIVRPSRLVYTQVFEPMAQAGHVVVTITFEELDGGTLMTSLEEYPSNEVRTMTLESGMEAGMRETMELLEQLVSDG